MFKARTSGGISNGRTMIVNTISSSAIAPLYIRLPFARLTSHGTNGAPAVNASTTIAILTWLSKWISAPSPIINAGSKMKLLIRSITVSCVRPAAATASSPKAAPS